MYALQERYKTYYKVNRVLLKALGIWPFQQSYFTRIHKTLFISILLTFILAQLLALVTTYNLNHFFKVLSLIFPFLFLTLKYCLFVIEADSVKEMFQRMQDDWRLLKDNLEIDIIEKYAIDVQFCSIVSVVTGFCCLFFLAMLQFFPLILDVILPLNESRPFQIITITEYFVNQEKYIYFILLHEMLSTIIAIVAIYGTVITVAIYMWHACALFKIASHRIENVIKKNALSIPISGQYLFYQKIVHAVFIHRRALEFAELITSNFTVLYAILILVGVTSLSINLFYLTLISNSVEDICIVILLIIIHLIYMFILNFTGQKVTDHGVELFKTIYNGLWYIAPLHTQKLLLFMMQKGNKNVTLIFGGLYIVSLEGFAALVNAAVSYFMVMRSTR